MSAILTSALTDATLEGSGVFDVLMRANKAHLEAEFSKNRIKGPEYATVYLGALTQVLQVSASFALAQHKAGLEADLLAEQIALSTAQRELVVQQKLQIQDAMLTAALQRTEVTAQIAQINAQTIGVTRQNDNLLIQGAQVTQQTLLLNQQTANALIEHDNLIKQGCVLASQFDMNMGTVARVAAETLLLTQKKITEAAQTTAQSVDDSSVVGCQKALYKAQTAGFARNSEQAATKLLIDTWSIRRTTDTGTLADGTNQLNDATIGRAVSKMLAGVGA